MKKNLFFFLFLAVLSVLLPAANTAYNFDSIKENISEFTLSNGLKFILLEDHSVPIVSFMTYVNVGASDERIGIYGISHFLEHMAFKGTKEIGTLDYKKEKKIMDKMDILFENIRSEKNAIQPDQEKLEKYEKELTALKQKAAQYVDDDTFTSIMERHGAVGLNAGTGEDSTVYTVSLPANKIELWAAMESVRFTQPVFREFYKERGVIMEERRSHVENYPIGQLFEELLALAFKDHPYRVSGIGPMSNIEHISRQDMISYFRENYTARNMIIGVTGDVTPMQLKRLAKKYFSSIRPGRKNPQVFTKEPPQIGEKTITVYADSQPVLVIGYHCPSGSHEDFLKFSVLDRILTAGRSSRLRRRLVSKDKSALGIFSMPGAPGDKYPGLYIFFTMPNMNHSNEEILAVIDEEIEKIKEDSVSEEELESAKTRIKVNILSGMKSNRGILMALLSAEATEGSWQKTFDTFDQLKKITTSDIQELVKHYLTRKNRSIAMLEKEKEEKKGKAKETAAAKDQEVKK